MRVMNVVAMPATVYRPLTPCLSFSPAEPSGARLTDWRATGAGAPAPSDRSKAGRPRSKDASDGAKKKDLSGW
jgi:hypothetical protein